MISVHLLPALIPSGALRGGVAVVIDVLRASTTIVHALAHGCEAVVPCLEIDEARRIAADDGADMLCVIGGGEIYALALPLATRMVLTHVDTEVEGADAFFPEIDPTLWREVARESHPADERHPHAFVFVDYARR